MGVVLRKRTNARQTVQFTRLLVAVEGRELGVAEGQVAVAVGLRVEEDHVRGAVHRLQEELGFAVDHRREHRVGVVLAVAGAVVELALHQVPGPDVLVARALLHLAHVALHQVAHGFALRQEEGDALPHDIREREEPKLAADAAVVALARLLELALVRIELVLRFEERPVHALELGVGLVTAPVGAGDAHQLERRNLAGVVHVAAAAEVGELAVGALRDGAVLDVREQVELEGLVAPALLRLGAGDGGHLEGQPPPDRLAHAPPQPGQVLLREGAGQAEVVVEAGGRGRPDTELGFGHQLDHRLGEHVRGGVAHAREAVLLREGGKVDVGFDGFWHGWDSPGVLAPAQGRRAGRGPTLIPRASRARARWGR